MKKGLGVLTAVIVSGLAAAIAVFLLAQNRSTPMSWLRAEFRSMSNKLEKSSKAVETRLYRARGILREKLDRWLRAG
jgi:hypothetical protein